MRIGEGETRVRRRGRWRFLLLGIALLLALAGGAGFFALSPATATEEGRAALASRGSVEVEVGRWLVFRPVAAKPTTGLIFYPGGKVDPVAYAPPARDIAAAGYLVVVVPMPLNLAVLDSGRAAEVIAAFPEVERWAVGGHSLGGAMAARFVRENPQLAHGLVLWAAYPDGADNLSARDLAVLSVSGTRDGLATPAKIEASRPLLPADTRWVAIEGGNHANFGWYGPQANDGAAAIGHAEQQALTVAATVSLLQNLADR